MFQKTSQKTRNRKIKQLKKLMIKKTQPNQTTQLQLITQKLTEKNNLMLLLTTKN
jgi:hypothetical protein